MDDNTRCVLLDVPRLLGTLIDRLPAIGAIILGYSVKDDLLEVAREILGHLL